MASKQSKLSVFIDDQRIDIEITFPCRWGKINTTILVMKSEGQVYVVVVELVGGPCA